MDFCPIGRMAAVEHPDAAHEHAILRLRRPPERGAWKETHLDLGMDRPRSQQRSIEREGCERRVGRHIGDHVEPEGMIGQHVVQRIARVLHVPRERELGLIERRLRCARPGHDRRPMPLHLGVALPRHEQLRKVRARGIRRARVDVGAVEPARQERAVPVFRARPVPGKDRAVRRDRELLFGAPHEREHEHRCEGWARGHASTLASR